MRIARQQKAFTRRELEQQALIHGEWGATFAQTFCHELESAGLVDFDADGRGHSLEERREFWRRFLLEVKPLAPKHIASVRASVGDRPMVLVTIAERVPAWRDILSEIDPRVDPYAEREVLADAELRSAVRIYDDHTLAYTALCELTHENDEQSAKLFAFRSPSSLEPVHAPS
jgi:hypothetical protein